MKKVYMLLCSELDACNNTVFRETLYDEGKFKEKYYDTPEEAFKLGDNGLDRVVVEVWVED